MKEPVSKPSRLQRLFSALAMLGWGALLLAAGGCGADQASPQRAGEAPGTEDAREAVPEAGDELPSAPIEPATNPVVVPDFTLQQVDGGTFSMSAQRGHVVVLNVWATWCGPCLYEIPDFIALQEELGDEGLVFVGVSVDEEGEDVVRTFVEEHGINYPVVVDDGRVSMTYGPFFGIPTTFIIGQDGRLRYFATGMVTRSALRPVLVQLLAETA